MIGYITRSEPKEMGGGQLVCPALASAGSLAARADPVDALRDIGAHACAGLGPVECFLVRISTRQRCLRASNITTTIDI